ncbi:GNAT family N-acetyltransferase [Pseudactinotalea suaedae]|uniref:GNAT family N-acetyltransferase n=1 Tax=Pseudactinotalea suaedae TaxID=1524924 RepID=UPI0012E21AEA|nr:GNAT family N-acetyltransferase [Pseudactinotalea suaedae]
MVIELVQPAVEDLPAAVAALSAWQREGGALQLHPGDLGWYWQAGPQRTAAAIRTWSRNGQLLAVGLLDGPGLVRMGLAPEADEDAELAERVAADLTDPARGVLPAGPVAVEARFGAALQRRLSDDGWAADEPWTPLRRALEVPLEHPGVRVETIGADRAHECVAVHRSAFDSARFTEERWHAMASGPAFDDARCLVAYDESGTAVATATVWSAGPGRPGLLEPMGVHAEHRGRGYGRAISVAAAAALQDMGASSATVVTPSSLVSAVRTYVAAGFEALPEVTDFRHGGSPAV